MGLFDPPTKNIFKRVPKDVQFTLVQIQTFAEISIPESVGRTKHACLVAMVMGAWVNAHARFGSFEMSAWNRASVQTTYENCARIAGEDAYLALAVIPELFERGLMPEGMADPFQ